VIDFIGASYLQQNLTVLQKDGVLVMLALMGGSKAENIDMSPVLQKRIHIKGTTLRNRNPEYKAKLAQEFIKYALPLFESKKLRPTVDTIFNWTECAQAHKYMEGNHNKGKIVLTID